MMIGMILQYPSFLSMTGFLAGYSGVYSPQSRRERGVFAEIKINQKPLRHSFFVCSSVQYSSFLIQYSILKKASVEREAFLLIYSVFYCCSGAGFTSPSFASRLSVAWGTARKRALSISLPVTRQIPYVLFSIRIMAFSR